MRDQANKFGKMEHEHGRATGEFYCNLDIGHAAMDQCDTHTHTPHPPLDKAFIHCMIHWINDLIDYNACCIT